MSGFGSLVASVLCTAVLLSAAMPCFARARHDRATRSRIWVELERRRSLVSCRRGAGCCSFSRVIRAVEPAVVFISTPESLTADPFFEFMDRIIGPGPKHLGQRPSQGIGSGFVINEEGLVLTNQHVVQGSDQVFLRTFDGRDYVADVVGSDLELDVALLRVPSGSSLKPVPLGDSSRMEVGDWVVAIGNPFGLAGSATKGIVSGLGRKGVRASGREYYSGFIQTDALINPGNSGGPLVNVYGEVVGINTAVNASGQGIGFAVPINLVKSILPELYSKGNISKPWIGIRAQSVTSELASSFGRQDTTGALISEVLAGSPAERAGILEGDIVLAVEGRQVAGRRELETALAGASVGEPLHLTIWRADREERIIVVPVERPSRSRRLPPWKGEALSSPVGLTVARLSVEQCKLLGLPDARQGALIVRVEPESEAHRRGLRPGDVILKVGKTDISGPASFLEALRNVEKRGVVRLLLLRGGTRKFVALRKP